MSKLDDFQFSSMKELPSYSFGKNSSRDQNSHMKQIVGYLNAKKIEEELLKKERMQNHTIGQYLTEEKIKRSAAIDCQK